MFIKVNYDGGYNLVKIEQYDTLTEETTKIIMDFTHGISYVFDSDESCIIRHIQQTVLDSDLSFISFVRATDDLLKMDNSTYYLGRVCFVLIFIQYILFPFCFIIIIFFFW